MVHKVVLYVSIWSVLRVSSYTTGNYIYNHGENEKIAISNPKMQAAWFYAVAGLLSADTVNGLAIRNPLLPRLECCKLFPPN